MRAAGDGATTRTGMKRVASDFPPPLGRGRPVALASRLAQPINVPACTPCDFAYSCAVSPLARHPATSACHSAALRRARRLARCNSTAFAMRSSYAAARYPHPARLQGAYPTASMGGEAVGRDAHHQQGEDTVVLASTSCRHNAFCTENPCCSGRPPTSAERLALSCEAPRERSDRGLRQLQRPS
jgi:hypothetical protein